LLLEIIRECLSAETERSIRDKVFPGIQKLFPFEFGGAGLGSAASGRVTITDSFDISLPLGFCEEYARSKYLSIDGLAAQNFKTYEVQYWSMSARTHYLTRGGVRTRAEIPREAGDYLSLLTDFGITSGYAHGCPTPATGEGGSYCGFFGPSVKYDLRMVEILEHLTPHLHLALLRAANRKWKDAGEVVLSARETEVLNWLKVGKSSWDISVVLGVSERTINFHVYNLMLKLGALNRPQAVAIAIRRGLIPLG
jgi:DNA-binding CsgD family transcriptional regulator